MIRRYFAVTVLILVTGGWTKGADILFRVSDAAVLGNADPAIKIHLESLGHTVNLLTTGTADQAAQLAAAGASAAAMSLIRSDAPIRRMSSTRLAFRGRSKTMTTTRESPC